VVGRYLDRLDRRLPGVVTGFYVVGSIALGGFRPGRSDIDFVATLERELSPGELAALRDVHRRASVGEGLRTLTTGPRSWPLVCNGVFVRREDLPLSPQTVTAVASQTAGRFVAGKGFDLNPVTLWTLAHGGIAVQGVPGQELAIYLDDAELRAWTAANLLSYWRPWARTVADGAIGAWRTRLTQMHSRRLAAWGVLGVARMHVTISTGTVVSKEEAGEYALDVFDPEWHPVIRDALAYWRCLPPVPRRTSRNLRTETAAFVLHVVDLVGAERRS
jgi:Domain of unknown function (DUF4111)/Nucleotidyltransferase domain